MALQPPSAGAGGSFADQDRLFPLCKQAQAMGLFKHILFNAEEKQTLVIVSSFSLLWS